MRTHGVDPDWGSEASREAQAIRYPEKSSCHGLVPDQRRYSPVDGPEILLVVAGAEMYHYQPPALMNRGVLPELSLPSHLHQLVAGECGGHRPLHLLIPPGVEQHSMYDAECRLHFDHSSLSGTHYHVYRIL